MNPEETIALLKGMQNKKVDYAEMVCAPAFAYGYEYVYPEPEDYAIEEAVKSLKEIQNYRKLGTLEELARAKRYIDLAKKHGTIGEMIDECAEYESIGTVEECREAVEKLTKAEKTLSSILSGNYNDECNFCVHNNNPMANCQCLSGDGSWCIHNAKWNGKISDIDNLEEVDNGT